MKKKLLSLCLVLALGTTAVIGGTLAYFTDTDGAVKNTFTIGNIDIDLWEYTGETTDGEQGEKVPVKDQDGYNYENLMPTQELTKEPYVENLSTTNAAYVRVAVVMNNLAAINDAIDETYEKQGKDATYIQNIYDEVFDGWGVNYSKRADFPGGSRMWMNSRVGEGSPVLCNIDTIAMISNKYYRIDCANTFMTDSERTAENGDGIFDKDWDDIENTYYYDAAKVGERVYVFYLKLDAGESYKLFDGLKVPAEFTNDQMKMFEGLKIDIYADAIQTEGFDSYTDAFNALEAEHPLGYWNT